MHINPYYLRLNFSHPLLEDDESSARYDPGAGYFTVTLTKTVKGQEFQDLDLLAKLLAPPTPSAPEGPLVEVVASESNEESEQDQLEEAIQKLSLEQKEILEGACLTASPWLPSE